jgi:hypothetical protein
MRARGREVSVVWAGFLLSCARPPRGEGEQDRRIVFERVAIDRYEQDRRIDRTSIARAYLDRSSGSVDGEGVEAVAFDAAGTRAMLEAGRLRADLGTRIVDFGGGVVIRDRSGPTIRSETLRYDSKRDELATESGVVLEGEGFRAEGGRLTGHVRGRRLWIEGPTTARIAKTTSDRGEP